MPGMTLALVVDNPFSVPMKLQLLAASWEDANMNAIWLTELVIQPGANQTLFPECRPNLKANTAGVNRIYLTVLRAADGNELPDSDFNKHLTMRRAYFELPLAAQAAPRIVPTPAAPSRRSRTPTPAALSEKKVQPAAMMPGVKPDNGVLASGSIHFRDLSELKEREAERTRIMTVLARYGARNVQWSGTDTVTFSELRTDLIPQLLVDLKYKPDTGSADGKVLMHELVDFSCHLEATYRTADIRAGIETTLSFQVTPGARLYYVAAPGQREQQVAVESSGTVSFRIKIARGQDAIYARTQLGAVNRYIRVDVYSGEVTEVTEAEYRAKTGR
jgi:hypothetical protein